MPTKNPKNVLTGSKRTSVTAHTSRSQVGTADYMGQALRPKVGRQRPSLSSIGSTKNTLGKPPKSLA